MFPFMRLVVGPLVLPGICAVELLTRDVIHCNEPCASKQLPLWLLAEIFDGRKIQVARQILAQQAHCVLFLHLFRPSFGMSVGLQNGSSGYLQPSLQCITGHVDRYVGIGLSSHKLIIAFLQLVPFQFPLRFGGEFSSARRA